MIASSEADVLDAARDPERGSSSGRDNVRKRLLGSVGWSAAASVFAQGCSFITLVLLARVLGREVFGQFALVQSTLVSLTTISGLGLGVTATKYISQYRIADPSKAGRILGLSALVTLAAAVCFTLALWFSAELPFPGSRPDDLPSSIRISTVYVFFITITSYQVGALAGFEAFRKIALINAVYGLATLLMSTIFALRWGLRGAVWGQCAGAVVLWLLYRRVLAGHCRDRRIVIRYKDAWRESGVLMRFAMPAAICGMVSSAASWGANVLLVRLAGFSELAIFSAALSMRSIALFTPALILRVTTPLLNNLRACGNFPLYRRILWRTTGANGLIVAVPAAVLSVAGPRVLALFGKSFRGSAWIAPLLLASVTLEVFSNNLFQVLFASGRLWLHLGIVVTWTAVLLGAETWWTPRGGAAGLAGSYLLAWLVSAVLYSAAVFRQLKANS